MYTVSNMTVIKILNDNLPEASVSENNLDCDLVNMGMDSIRFIQIVVALEETFQCEIPDSKLLISEMDTAQKIIDVLKTLYN